MDLLLLFGLVCLGLALAWFFGYFDEERGSRYSLSLSNGRLEFQDDWIEVEFGFGRPEDLDELKHIPLSLGNRTGRDIAVDWKSCALVDPEGDLRPLVPDELPEVGRRGAAAAPGVVRPDAEIDVLLIPEDNIGGPSLRLSSLKRHLLLARWTDRRRIPFAVLLVVVSGGEKRDYRFEFVARRTRTKGPDDAGPYDS